MLYKVQTTRKSLLVPLSCGGYLCVELRRPLEAEETTKLITAWATRYTSALAIDVDFGEVMASANDELQALLLLVIQMEKHKLSSGINFDGFIERLVDAINNNSFLSRQGTAVLSNTALKQEV